MTKAERWALLLFVVATVLAFYAWDLRREPSGLTPAFAFLALGLTAFAVRVDGEPPHVGLRAGQEMMWGLFTSSPAATLGAVLNTTGTRSFSPAPSPRLRGNGRFGRPSSSRC
jgi:hypothetical protein